MKKLEEAITAVVLMAVFIIVFGLILAGIANWLWGLIIVPVFGAPVLTYWQMYGIMILIRLLIPTFSNSSSSN